MRNKRAVEDDCRCRGDRDGEGDGDSEGDEGRRRYLREDGDMETFFLVWCAITNGAGGSGAHHI
jgi:hypothetical protein